MAVLEFAEAVIKGAETCHTGAILVQANRAYKYIGKWATKNEEKFGVTKSTKQETRFLMADLLRS